MLCSAEEIRFAVSRFNILLSEKIMTNINNCVCGRWPCSGIMTHNTEIDVGPAGQGLIYIFQRLQHLAASTPTQLMRLRWLFQKHADKNFSKNMFLKPKIQSRWRVYDICGCI